MRLRWWEWAALAVLALAFAGLLVFTPASPSWLVHLFRAPR